VPGASQGVLGASQGVLGASQGVPGASQGVLGASQGVPTGLAMSEGARLVTSEGARADGLYSRVGA